MLEALCDVVADWNLYDIMTDPRASHVARRLLSVSAGRDVSPASNKKVLLMVDSPATSQQCFTCTPCV